MGKPPFRPDEMGRGRTARTCRHDEMGRGCTAMAAPTTGWLDGDGWTRAGIRASPASPPSPQQYDLDWVVGKPFFRYGEMGRRDTTMARSIPARFPE